MRRVLPALLLVLMWLSACGGEPEAVRDDAGAVATEGAVDAFAVSLGDCLSDEVPDQGEVESVPAVPCEQPHTGEVYALFDLPDGEFPGEDAVGEATDTGCIERFEAFAGIAYDDSVYEYSALQPTQETWDRLDDREVVCIITDPSGPSTGSLKGVAK